MTDFDSIKEQFDLKDVIERLQYSTLTRSQNGPCPICREGRDRFYVHKCGKRCGCRICGFQGDVIDLVQKVENLSLHGAIEFLTGRAISDYQPRLPRHTPHLVPPSVVPPWHDPQWQRKGIALIKEAESQLCDSPGEHYLRGRGLLRETAQIFRIGFDPSKFDLQTQRKRPAIVIPWLDHSGTLTAIKYRFIDELAKSGKSHRFTQSKGSDPILFGLNNCEAEVDALIIVEGELNALAIFQAMDSLPIVNVVSIGSQQNPRGLECARRLRSRLPAAQALLWLDDEEHVRDAAKGFHAPILCKSPRGLDACDLLGKGVLKEFICELLRHSQIS